MPPRLIPNCLSVAAARIGGAEAHAGFFFDHDAFGGILVDIASHQIDQFLFFTGASDAEIVASSVANRTVPDFPDFEDFGEILLRSNAASGYIRVDWLTPDGLPTWGDGRLFLLGTEGTIDDLIQQGEDAALAASKLGRPFTVYGVEMKNTTALPTNTVLAKNAPIRRR